MIGRRVLLASLLLSAGCVAKVVVVKLDGPGPAPANGLVYALPTTVIRTQLKVERTDRTAAPYAEYAAIFAPGAEPVCDPAKCPSPVYAVQPGATFSTYGEPDRENVYLVKFKGSGVVDQTVSMTWNDAGLLSGAGASTTNRVADVVASGVKAVASIGTKLALGAPAEATRKVGPACPDRSDADAFFLGILVQTGALPGPAATYCDLPKEKRNALKPDPALFTAAAKAYATRIGPLAKTARDLLSGGGDALEPTALLARVEAEIERVAARLYVGAKKVQTWEALLDARPAKLATPGAIPSIVLLRLDAEKGLCLADAALPPESKPVPKEFVHPDAAKCASAPALTLALAYRPEPDRQLFTRIADPAKEGEDRSFRYRIPAQVAVQLVEAERKAGEGERKLGAAVVSVAQLGTVISLPAANGGKGLSYDLSFVEATGALKTFKLGSTALIDAALADALGTAGGTLADARATARKNDDELTALTRQQSILKARDEICEIQKKYGLACDVAPQ